MLQDDDIDMQEREIIASLEMEEREHKKYMELKGKQEERDPLRPQSICVLFQLYRYPRVTSQAILWFHSPQGEAARPSRVPRDRHLHGMQLKAMLVAASPLPRPSSLPRRRIRPQSIMKSIIGPYRSD